VAVRGQAYRDIGRVPSIPASIIPTLARVMPQNLAVSLRSNQQSRVSCFARSADFKLGQQVAAESQQSLVAHIKSVWSRPQSQHR
jgi:hypothetical protein